MGGNNRKVSTHVRVMYMEIRGTASIKSTAEYLLAACTIVTDGLARVGLRYKKQRGGVEVAIDCNILGRCVVLERDGVWSPRQTLSPTTSSASSHGVLAACNTIHRVPTT